MCPARSMQIATTNISWSHVEYSSIGFAAALLKIVVDCNETYLLKPISNGLSKNSCML